MKHKPPTLKEVEDYFNRPAIEATKRTRREMKINAFWEFCETLYPIVGIIGMILWFVFFALRIMGK